MSLVIDIDRVGKLYRLGKIGTGTLSHDIKRWWADIRGKEDPYAKIGAVNDRTQKGADGEYVWAIRDITFRVQAGEVVGIIGKNGAGKSTLLKILSRITTPTTGSIKIKGRIGSLLEVGTGFHLEMTGRENIYMNGTILGMRRSEISRKFDEIVEFAGVAKYIDTPVKRYSSGMTVRLGFAVAAFLEPEILVVDEVLAVGDAEFQKRAIGKMQDVSRSGRTVLFVSHNMRAVKRLCKRGVVLSNGGVVLDAGIDEAVNFYLSASGSESNSGSPVLEWKENDAPGNAEVKLLKAIILGENGSPSISFLTSEAVQVQLYLKVSVPLKNIRFNIHLMDEEENIIFVATSQNLLPPSLDAGHHMVTFVIPPDLLNERMYVIRLSAGIQGVQTIVEPLTLFSFSSAFADNTDTPTHFVGKWPGVVAPALQWRLKNLNK